MTHYFPTPWTAECFVLKDATGQALTHIYGRETRADADGAAKVLTIDESRRVGVGETNVAVAFPSRRGTYLRGSNVGSFAMLLATRRL